MYKLNSSRYGQEDGEREDGGEANMEEKPRWRIRFFALEVRMYKLNTASGKVREGEREGQYGGEAVHLPLRCV